MYVVTNRHVDESAGGIEQFGAVPNKQGNNELRLARVSRAGRGWNVQFYDDLLDPGEARELIAECRLSLDPNVQHFASLKVACELARRAEEKQRHILFFVHGYNNDMAAVMQTAHSLELAYDVEVLTFSWPARGGGWRGKASYLSDKRDARASSGALERCLMKMRQHLMLISESAQLALRTQAERKHPENAEQRDALLAQLLQKHCGLSINAMFHSMGNYLYKQMLKSSINEGNGLIFDNVVLCQADVNNRWHADWVDRIAHNRRVFITINENDHALRLSRIKPGSAQRARLGHYIKRLDSRVANYINLTNAAWVRNSHSPFAEPAEKNQALKQFFLDAFSGKPAELSLKYRPETHCYELPR